MQWWLRLLYLLREAASSAGSVLSFPDVRDKKNGPNRLVDKSLSHPAFAIMSMLDDVETEVRVLLVVALLQKLFLFSRAKISMVCFTNFSQERSSESLGTFSFSFHRQ